MQRDYRYTLGENLKKELVDMLVHIYRANCRYQKTEQIAQARENLEIVKLMWRLCNELKQIPLKTFALASEKLENISRQLTAWMHIAKLLVLHALMWGVPAALGSGFRWKNGNWR